VLPGVVIPAGGEDGSDNKIAVTASGVTVPVDPKKIPVKETSASKKKKERYRRKVR
jgi:hypothetical protein